MTKELSKEYLKCPLTEAEMKKEAEKMANCISKLSELEGTLKSAKKRIESDIAMAEAELSLAAEKYQSGFEMRNVEVETTKNFKTNTVTVTRTDTGEILRERPMSVEERQESLFDKKDEANLPDADEKGYMKERKEVETNGNGN